MMLEQHLIGELSYHDRAGAVGFDHQEGLILLGSNAGLTGGNLAEGKKLSQCVTKPGEPLVEAWIEWNGVIPAMINHNFTSLGAEPSPAPAYQQISGTVISVPSQPFRVMSWYDI